MGERREVILAELLQNKGYIRGPFGSALKRPEMKSEGIPVYEQQHAIYNSREFRFYIDEKKFEELKRFQVKNGDIVISCSGTVGKVTIIKEDDPKGIISQALLILRVDESKVLPEYLKYFFSSQEGYNAIVSRSSGSVQVNISKREVIEQIPISLPTISEQEKIVSILKSIDDKVQTNSAINRNLQEQAVAIYKEMILDSAEELCGIGKLSDVAVITMGQSPKGDTYNEEGNGAVFYQGRGEFGWRFPTRRLFTTEPKRMAMINDVLISVRAPVGDVNVAYEECCIGRGLGAIHSKDNHQSYVLYTVLSLKEKFEVFNGEGTVFGSINRDGLNNMEIVIPPAKVRDSFEELVAPIDKMIKSNYEEIICLTELRDALLPKLMSGELDVSDLDI